MLLPNTAYSFFVRLFYYFLLGVVRLTLSWLLRSFQCAR